MVHSGYVKYRKKLLEAGVELFEMKTMEGAPKGREELNAFGLSGASLHAKSFSIDDDRIFIGSFNFDPRSALLNCEMGFLIDSSALARRLSQAFDTELPAATWQPELADDDLVWVEFDSQGNRKVLNEEPGSTLVNRMTITVLGWLPIEWLL